MASFICKEIDDNVWRKVKANAAMEGVSLKDLFLSFFTAYAEKEPKKNRPATK